MITSYLAGLGGLSLQVLLYRWLSTLVGSSLPVQITLVGTYMLFLGFGSFYHKNIKLPLSLLLIILLLISILFGLTWPSLPITLSPYFTNNSTKVGMVFLCVLLPAFLTGILVPRLTFIFSQKVEKDKYSLSFNRVNFYYHLGAASCLLLIEVIFIFLLGVSGCFYFSALAFLLALFTLNKAHLPTADRIEESSAQLSEVFFISVSFGILHVIFYKSSLHLFGPFPQNYSALVSSSLLSLSFASFISERWHITQRKYLKNIIPLLMFALVIFLTFARLLPYWNELWLNAGPDFVRFVKFITVVVFYAPLFMLLSLLIPSYHVSGYKITGKLLGVNAFGNTVGYILTIFIFLSFFSFKYLLLISLLFLIIILYLNKKTSFTKLIPVVLFFPIFLYIPNKYFYFSYRFFESPKIFDNLSENITGIKSYVKLGGRVDIMEMGKERMLVIDGYKSILLNPNQSFNPHEFLLGYLQKAVVPNYQSALVLGVGSGITVAANALTFDKVIGVEIHPVILELQDEFKNYNLNLKDMINVDLKLGDGFNYLLNSRDQFDLIVNNVPTPQYSVASNLWTKDFLNIVKEKLTKKGVYSQWLSGAINKKAIQVTLRTLTASFEHCALAILNSTYSNILCSMEPIQVQNINIPSLNRFLDDKFTGFNLGLLIFPIKSLKEQSQNIPSNTLNNPSLQRYLHPYLSQIWLDKKDWFIFDFFNFHEFDLVKERCELISKLDKKNETLPPFCL
jgi:predicted membrane-bound spermidine synthase